MPRISKDTFSIRPSALISLLLALAIVGAQATAVAGWSCDKIVHEHRSVNVFDDWLSNNTAINTTFNIILCILLYLVIMLLGRLWRANLTITKHRRWLRLGQIVLSGVGVVMTYVFILGIIESVRLVIVNPELSYSDTGGVFSECASITYQLSSLGRVTLALITLGSVLAVGLAIARQIAKYRSAKLALGTTKRT